MVLRVEPDALVVRTSKGVGRVEYRELTEEERIRFSYDAKKEEEWRDTVAKTEAREAMVQATAQLVETIRRQGAELTITVLQVTDNGILGFDDDGVRVLIRGANQSRIVDGGRYTWTVWRVGTYRYTTILGATSTVRRFTASLEEAVRGMPEED